MPTDVLVGLAELEEKLKAINAEIEKFSGEKCPNCGSSNLVGDESMTEVQCRSCGSWGRINPFYVSYCLIPEKERLEGEIKRLKET